MAFVGVTEAVDGAVGVIAVNATRRRRVRSAAAVFRAGTAVAVLRAALAGGTGSAGVTTVAAASRRVRAAAVFGTSATIAVFGAALPRGAVGAAGAFTLTSEQLGRSGGNGRSHGQEERESGLLHCER